MPAGWEAGGNDPVTNQGGQAVDLRRTGTSPVWRFVRFAGDVSSESAQRLGKTRVTAVDVVGWADRRDAIGNKSGDDQCRPGPDVAGLDGSAGEPSDAMTHDVMPIDSVVSTQPPKPLHGAHCGLDDDTGYTAHAVTAHGGGPATGPGARRQPRPSKVGRPFHLPFKLSFGLHSYQPESQRNQQGCEHPLQA